MKHVPPGARRASGFVGALQGRFHRSRLRTAVWVALFDDAPVFAAEANAPIQRPRVKIAICPLVENGVVRVLNLPSDGRRGAPGLARVRGQLQRACSDLDGASPLSFDRAITLDAVHGAKAQHQTIL